jgi:hypothetical protein
MSSYGTNGTDLRDSPVPLVAPRSGTESPIGALSRPAASAVQSPANLRAWKLSRSLGLKLAFEVQGRERQ